MAIAPTETEVRTQIGLVCEALYQTYQFAGQTAGDNWLDMEGDVLAALETNYGPEALAGLQQIRNYIAAALSSDAWRSALEPFILEYARIMDVPYTDMASLFYELRRLLHAAGDTIQERNFTFGSPAAGGSNVGDGVVNRLNVDQDGYELENQTPDDKEVRCTGDEFSGSTEHEERFVIAGGAAFRDGLLVSGSGKSLEVRAASGNDAAQIIQNPAWADYEGTVGAPTALAGWTVQGGGSPFTNLVLDSSNIYRTLPNQAAADAVSLQFNADELVYQGLANLGYPFDPNVPVYAQVAFNRQVGAGDGTLWLRLGGSAVSVVLAAQTGWNILRILGQACWFKNWNQADAQVQVELAGRTTGSVLVGEVLVVPMTPFDGGWYCIVGGGTKFRRDDLFTWSDTEVGSKIQFVLWLAFGEYLPASAAPTWSDPA